MRKIYREELYVAIASGIVSEMAQLDKETGKGTPLNDRDVATLYFFNTITLTAKDIIQVIKFHSEKCQSIIFLAVGVIVFKEACNLFIV